MCTAAVAGIAIGSIFGGDFVKSGRRLTILQFNVIGLIGTFISFIPVFYMMCFGRFVFGFSCGVLICTTPTAISETVPSNMVDKGFGTSTNIIINLSFMLVAVLSLMMPETEFALTNDWTWMIIFGAQIPLQICAIILHLFVYTEEPIDFNIRMGNK
jgi:MFS family permease